MIIPIELWNQVLYHLDANDIINFVKSGITENLMDATLRNKYFWLNKTALSYPAYPITKEYLIYFDLIESNNPEDITEFYRPINKTGYLHLDNYDKFLTMYSYIIDFIEGMNLKSVRLVSYIKKGVRLSDVLINNNLRDVKNILSINRSSGFDNCIIQFRYGDYSYYKYKMTDTLNNVTIMKSTIDKKDIINLLIKFELLDYMKKV